MTDASSFIVSRLPGDTTFVQRKSYSTPTAKTLIEDTAQGDVPGKIVSDTATKDRYCSRFRKAGLSSPAARSARSSSSAFSKCFQIGWPEVIQGTVALMAIPASNRLPASRREIVRAGVFSFV